MRSAVVAAVLVLVIQAEQEPIKSDDLPWPTRPLEWKDANFLSTSDTHGWLLGHQHATWPEPNYSGNYGDLASFATHLRAIADDRGVDLLLVDAGDHHDGSGLVSTSSASAARADEIFSMLEYDVLTIGNHELYRWEVPKEIYDTRHRWKGRYLTSNVNITIEDEDGRATSVPVGERFAKFETKRGRKVTAFGILYDFRDHGHNISVQAPIELARESWFLDAIEDTPDFFVLAGHMPARGPQSDWIHILQAIRRRHPTVPVFAFGGHTHVRDCVQYDQRSIGSEMPAKDDLDGPLSMSRRYLDANRRSYLFHSNRTFDDFDTPLGWDITSALLRLATELNISEPLGRAPHDFFLSRYPLGDERSVLTEWMHNVIPMTVKDPTRPGPRIIIAQSGSLRFNVFQGVFDRNDELTLSPFENEFVYIPLPAGLARNLTDQLNRAGPSRMAPLVAPSMTEDELVEQTYQEWLSSQWEEHIAGSGPHSEQTTFNSGKRLPTLGYVTRDACPGKGDDIEHIPVPHSWPLPDFLSTPFPTEDISDDDLVDVAVMKFSLHDFVVAVNKLDPTLNLSVGDVKPYAPDVAEINLWGLYAGMAWQN